MLAAGAHLYEVFHSRKEFKFVIWVRGWWVWGSLKCAASSLIRIQIEFCPAVFVSSLISVDPTDQKKTACYDIDVEVDDPLKGQMNSFLSSTTNQQEIAALEMKVWSGSASHLMKCTPHKQGIIKKKNKIFDKRLFSFTVFATDS